MQSLKCSDFSSPSALFGEQQSRWNPSSFDTCWASYGVCVRFQQSGLKRPRLAEGGCLQGGSWNCETQEKEKTRGVLGKMKREQTKKNKKKRKESIGRRMRSKDKCYRGVRREVRQGPLGGGVAASPLLHTQNCGMSRDRGVATQWSATGGGVACAPLSSAEEMRKREPY